MKHKVLIAAILIVSAVLITPVATKAVDIQSQIQALMQQIATLQAQLKELQGQQGGESKWCHTFNANMGIGSSGSGLDALITVFDKESIAEFLPSNRPSEYNEVVAGMVSAFQQKYASEILTPNGLKYPTGYVGKSTRSKLNALYGCKADSNLPVAKLFASMESGYRFGYDTISIPTGEKVVLNWTSENTTSCVMNSGPESDPSVPAGRLTVFGRATVAPTQKTTYSVTCYNNNGEYSTSNAITLILREEPSTSPTVSITINGFSGPEVLIHNYGETVNLDWKSSNASACFLKSNASAYTTPLSSVTGTIPLRPEGDTSYVVVCSNSTGQSVSSNSIAVVRRAQQPSITVISPNGGEAWEAGKTYPIKILCGEGINKTINIDFQDERGGTVYTRLFSDVTCRPGEVANYNWNIAPASLFGSNAFKIKVATTDGSVSDESDNYFSIVAASTQPSITVTSPKLNDNFESGKPVVIQWISQGMPSNAVYNIFIYDSLGANKQIATNLPASTTSFTWTADIHGFGFGLNTKNFWQKLVNFVIPEVNAAGGGYYIKVCADEGVCANSGIFGIFPTTQPSITVISPNGGEAFTVGQSAKISWKYAGTPELVDEVKISFLDYASGNAPVIYAIKPVSSSVSYYNHMLSSNMASGSKYKVMLEWMRNGSMIAMDVSDNYFSIVAPSSSANRSPVISEVSGPTSIVMGQSGTWTVNATDPDNDSLSYRVIWGIRQ